MAEAAKAQATTPKKTENQANQVPPAPGAPKPELFPTSRSPTKTLAAMSRARAFLDQARVHARKEIEDDTDMIDILNSLRTLDDEIAEVEEQIKGEKPKVKETTPVPEAPKAAAV